MKGGEASKRERLFSACILHSTFVHPSLFELLVLTLLYSPSFSFPSQRVRVDLLQQLQNLQGAPSVQMQEVPPPFLMKREIGGDDGGSQDDERNDEGDIGGEEGSTKKEHDAELAA